MVRMGRTLEVYGNAFYETMSQILYLGLVSFSVKSQKNT